MTMLIAELRLRVNPNVAVPVAMSDGVTLVCIAMSGAWKLGPNPTAAIIWNSMRRGQLLYDCRLMNKPKPNVANAMPPIISSI